MARGNNGSVRNGLRLKALGKCREKNAAKATLLCDGDGMLTLITHEYNAPLVPPITSSAT